MVIMGRKENVNPVGEIFLDGQSGGGKTTLLPTTPTEAKEETKAPATSRGNPSPVSPRSPIKFSSQQIIGYK